MSSKLTKTFLSKDEIERLTVSCTYDYSNKEISDVKVEVWNRREQCGFDMTSVWDNNPVFIELVDNIDWKEIYAKTNIPTPKGMIQLPAGKTIVHLSRGGNHD